jgi:hypothetical protein
VDVTEMAILSDQGGAGCFSWGAFVEGGRYLVYAEETGEKNLAVLFSWNRTAALAYASEDLKELERMSQPSFDFNPKRLSMSESSLPPHDEQRRAPGRG